MKIAKIIDKLSCDYPASMALPWDNPGLQVGNPEHSVKKIYVALDATDKVIEECISWGADLLVTHHPLLMSGIKSVCSDDLHGGKILAMAENRIAHYAIHTNYDVTTMARLAQDAMKLKKTKILEVTGRLDDGTEYGIGFCGEAKKKMTAEECCGFVKKAFGLPNVRLFGNKDAEVKKIALSPGSGKSMIAPALKAGADILITGDIGHHDGLDSVDQGLLIIDAGHYGIEHIFIHQISSYLQESFPDVKVRKAEIRQPF